MREIQEASPNTSYIEAASAPVVPRADSVAKAMRLSYRDQSAQSAFMDYGGMESLLQKAEEMQAH